MIDESLKSLFRERDFSQPRGSKSQKFSVASDPTMVGPPASLKHYTSTFQCVSIAQFIIQKFTGCLSLSFKCLTKLMSCSVFLSCSLIINFRWLLKSWQCLLKCLLAFGFWTCFLCLLSLLMVFLICQRIECCRYSILVDKWQSYFYSWLYGRFYAFYWYWYDYFRMLK